MTLDLVVMLKLGPMGPLNRSRGSVPPTMILTKKKGSAPLLQSKKKSINSFSVNGFQLVQIF